MKRFGKCAWLLASLCSALAFILVIDASAAPQDQPKPPKPDALTVKQHPIPKNTHSKSKTFTDDWNATQGGKGHKGKGVPDDWENGQSGGKSNSGTTKDRWVGTGNGKSGKTHQDDWIATDVKTGKTTTLRHPKPQVHAVTRSPK